MKPSSAPSAKKVRFHMPRTARAATGMRGRAVKTARATGRRGLQELLGLYEGLNGFNANTLGLHEFRTTYGEMTEQGIQTLSSKFQIYAPATRFSATQRVFYDLGCGVGRIVVGMAILHPEIQGRGIEIVPDRIRWANQALERIRSRQVATRIQFRQGSFLDSELSLRDACWIFISNLCFDEATQHEIVKKVEAECAPNTIIICSKELPFSKETSQFERVEAGTNIPMTWSATSTCNIYRRKALII